MNEGIYNIRFVFVFNHSFSTNFIAGFPTSALLTSGDNLPWGASSTTGSRSGFHPLDVSGIHTPPPHDHLTKLSPDSTVCPLSDPQLRTTVLEQYIFSLEESVPTDGKVKMIFKRLLKWTLASEHENEVHFLKGFLKTAYLTIYKWWQAKEKSKYPGTTTICLSRVSKTSGQTSDVIQKELAQQMWTPEPFFYTWSNTLPDLKHTSLVACCIKFDRWGVKLYILSSFNSLLFRQLYGGESTKTELTYIKYNL